MSVNLVKGQKIDLTKGNTGLNDIAVGLGWDVLDYIEIEEKGFLGKTKIVRKNVGNADLDACAFLLRNGKFQGKNDEVTFRNTRHSSQSVMHSGDNLTGEGAGDDETINVTLNKVPEDVDRIVFAVNIYSAHMREQHFGLVKNAYIRIYDRSNENELCKFNLTDDYKGMTGLICGEIYRHDGEWKFNAIGEGLNVENIDDMERRYM